MLDDEDIDRFHNGDANAFRALVSELSPRMLAAAVSFTQDIDEAHDLVQVAWSTVWVRRERFRSDGELEGWIMRILYRTCLQAHRSQMRRKARESRSEEWVESRRVDPVDRIDTEEKWERLHKGLAQLSPKELNVTLLTFRDGLTSTEVGERLGLSSSTVRVHLARARKKLKAIQGGLDGDG